jgi:hypothetical protein
VYPDSGYDRYDSQPLLPNSTYWLVLLTETHDALSGKVKVKVTLEQATKAQKGSRGIAILFL